jgi:UDP-GlcNAc:undecaprenyl-phosphate GlcNAc-1-phosphate transferase
VDFVKGFHVDLTEIVVLLATIVFCIVILRTRTSLLNRRASKDLRQFHSTHAQPVPRLGGAGMFAGFLLTILFFDGDFGGRHARVLVSMLPMLAVTLWEDTLRPTSPRIRLMAVLASCLLTLGSLQVWLTSIDLPLIDLVMPGIAGFLITAALILGTVNGFNMIDGLNGLCAGTALAALLALNFIAMAVGYEFMVHVSMALGAAVAGFLVFNFPRARLFLGDTGAYVLGYLIALFGISLCYRFPAVSPWAVFLIIGYPLSEVVITFFRRLLAGVSPFQPDNLHLHHLVQARVQRLRLPGKLQAHHNPIATILILPLAIGPMIFAAVNFDSPRLLQAVAAAYGLAMIGVYAMLRVKQRGKSSWEVPPGVVAEEETHA